MKYELQNSDYLELWKYFEDKASSVKGAMFTTTTWIIGFAAGLLAFIFFNMTNYDSEKAFIDLSTLMTLASVSGLVICLYAFFAIGEAAKHIRNNWARSKRCRKEIEGLNDLVTLKYQNGESKVEIWNQLRIVVVLFLIAFSGIFIWSLIIRC